MFFQRPLMRQRGTPTPRGTSGVKQLGREGYHSSASGAEFNPLNAELNPICCMLALLGAHHFLHVSRIRVKSFTLRLLMSYIYIYIYIWSTHS